MIVETRPVRLRVETDCNLLSTPPSFTADLYNPVSLSVPFVSFYKPPYYYLFVHLVLSIFHLSLCISALSYNMDEVTVKRLRCPVLYHIRR